MNPADKVVVAILQYKQAHQCKPHCKGLKYENVLPKTVGNFKIVYSGYNVCEWNHST